MKTDCFNNDKICMITQHTDKTSTLHMCKRGNSCKVTEPTFNWKCSRSTRLPEVEILKNLWTSNLWGMDDD